MIFNPALKVGPVDVLCVNPKVKSVSMIIHIHVDGEYIPPVEDAKILFHKPISNAYKYLIAEGFVEAPISEWINHIAMVYY